jgi:hypothetical protein
MRWILRQRPSPSMLVALAALAVALGGVAYATIPDSNGTIHGCFNKQNGNLRVVDSGASCKSGEAPIQWSRGGTGTTALSGSQSVAGSQAPSDVNVLDVPGFGTVIAKCLVEDPQDLLATLEFKNTTDRTEDLGAIQQGGKVVPPGGRFLFAAQRAGATADPNLNAGGLQVTRGSGSGAETMEVFATAVANFASQSCRFHAQALVPGGGTD